MGRRPRNRQRKNEELAARSGGEKGEREMKVAAVEIDAAEEKADAGQERHAPLAAPPDEAAEVVVDDAVDDDAVRADRSAAPRGASAAAHPGFWEGPDDEGERRAKRRRIRTLVAVIGGLLLVVAAIALLANNGKSSDAAAAKTDQAAAKADGAASEKSAVPVRVAPVTVGSASAYISSAANLIAESDVQVLSEVEGRVAAILVEEGDRVTKGEALATLVHDDQEIAYKKAQLKESSARQAFERGRELHDKGLISQEEYDKVSTDSRIAEQELAEAKWALDKTTIRAPFAGRVTTRMAQAGQHLHPGDALFQVTDFDPLIARIFLPQKDVLGLTTGQAARLTLSADPTVTFAGRIRQISPVVDTATGTVKVTLEAVRPPAEARPGSFITVDIVRETHDHALLLPKEAVLRELGEAHVFLAENGKAVKRDVELGIAEGDEIEVVSGLAAGDQVIVAGQGGLKDGSAVEVITAGASRES